MKSSGPLEPGSIQEAIVAIYWMQQKSADIHLQAANILADADRKLSSDMFKTYIEKFAPYMSLGTSQQTLSDMQSKLKEWVSKGPINVPIGPPEHSVLYNKRDSARKAAGAVGKEKGVGRGRTPLSGRDRPRKPKTS